MSSLSPLDAAIHGDLKVLDDRIVQYAKPRHMIPLNVTEVPQAAMCMPVLISRFEGKHNYALSAITSFVPGTNLFVKDEKWRPVFVPAEMQTFPLGVIPATNGGEPMLAIDPTMPVFSKEKGTALFEEKGRPSLWLSQMEALLRDHVQKRAQTLEFLQGLVQLDLIAPLNISVHVQGGAINQISGLMSINEDRLKGLSPEEVLRLDARGYLPVIYALLFSLYQLNVLIQRANEQREGLIIEKINLEVARGPAAG